MLRRLSDVTLGSIEKILNLNGNNVDVKEKKRKLAERNVSDASEGSDKENKNVGSRLRKSKGQWDLLKSTASDVESPNKSVKTNASDSDDDSKVVIDLTEISSSEIPSDLSINEEDFWSDYEHLNEDQDEYFKSLKLKESRLQPLSKNLLLKNHPDLSFTMRAKLINWLFEVALHYKLQKQTIYSTQMLLDQFLTFSKLPQTRHKLQLIGLGALLIACKLEEVRPPNLSDLTEICDMLYKESEIAKMELEICTTLKWNLTPINILSWIRIYSERNTQDCALTDTNYEHEASFFTCTQWTHGTHCTIEYITDLMIHSPEFLNFRPSALSAAIISLTIQESSIENCTGYAIEELTEEIKFVKSWIKQLGFENVDEYTDYGRLCNLGIRDVIGQIAYCCPKRLSGLKDSEFLSLVQFNRKALSFILKRIKQG